MLALPPVLSDLIQRLSSLPGIGPKAAERLGLALLRRDLHEVQALADALLACRERVGDCPRCGCLSQDGELCAVCADGFRDGRLLCVVETALDAIALERGGGFKGRYHVLGGALSPLRGVLPEDLRIAQLLARIREESTQEVVLATNASPDGEATALYLKQELLALAQPEDALQAPLFVRITRLARGLPSGAQLDYADAATLHSALEHRTDF
ncbi:recombination protein RecR [bacterium]|nr:recombination protein RecR [bacterium]